MSVARHHVESKLEANGRIARAWLTQRALKSGQSEDWIRTRIAEIAVLSDDDAIDQKYELSAQGIVATRHTLERIGLGYRATFSGASELAESPVLTLRRVRESRGEIHGELSIRFAGLDREPDFLRATGNLSSLTWRRTTARDCGERRPGNWRLILENFCVAVLEQEARGPELEVVGQQPRRSRGSGYLLGPILPLGKPTIVYGAGGTGKSTLAAGIAVATVTGRQVVPGWQPTPGPVLVLDWEGEQRDWNDLVSKVAEGIGVTPPAIYRLRMRRTLADDLEAVAAYVGEQCALLVIVDSVGLAIGATREGQSWHDGAFRLFEALRRLETTSLLIDHVAGADLGNNGPATKPYGAVYKLNLARSAFELRRENEGSPGRTEMLLLHRKVNDGPLLPSQGLAILHDGEDGPIRFERAEVQASELVGVLSVPARMARLLRTGPQTDAALAKDCGTTQSNIRSILSRDDGERFTRTPDGKIALAAHV